MIRKRTPVSIYAKPRYDTRFNGIMPRYENENTRKADRNWLRCAEIGDYETATKHEKIGAIFARLERRDQ